MTFLKEIRDRLKLKAGDRVEIQTDGDRIVTTPGSDRKWDAPTPGLIRRVARWMTSFISCDSSHIGLPSLEI